MTSSMHDYGQCFNLTNSSANDLWNEDAQKYFLNDELAKLKEKLYCLEATPLRSDGELLLKDTATAVSQTYIVNEKRWELLRKLHGDKLNCTLRSLETGKSLPINYRADEFYNKTFLIKNAMFSVTCRNKSKSVLIESYYNFHSNKFDKMERRKRKIDRSFKLQKNMTKNESLYNIIILGIDSLSSQTMQRSLPLSFEYMKSQESIFFRYSHIIGANTFPNFLGLLTGMLQDKMQNISINGYHEFNGDLPRLKKFDDLPFLWKYLPDNYVTYKQEDYAGVGMFNYLLPGFRRQPTDIYFRSYYKEYEYKSNICRKAKHFYDNVNQFLDRMNGTKLPFFMLTCFNKYTHNDIVLASLIDKELLGTLKNIKQKFGSNSLVLIYGDHGARLHSYGYYSTSGILERKKSTMMLYVPRSLRKKYPEKMRNLEKNSDKIVTPIDLHYTFLEILSLTLKENLLEKRKNLLLDIYNGESKDNYTSLDEVRQARNMRPAANQNLSLLSKSLGRNRSCQEANINLHHCLCSSRYRKVPLRQKYLTLMERFSYDDRYRLNHWKRLIDKNLIFTHSKAKCRENHVLGIQHYSHLTYHTKDVHSKDMYMNKFDMLTITFHAADNTRFEAVVLIEQWTKKNGETLTESDRKLLEATRKLEGKYNEVINGILNKSKKPLTFLKYILVNLKRLDAYERTSRCLDVTASRLTKSMCICAHNGYTTNVLV